MGDGEFIAAKQLYNDLNDQNLLDNDGLSSFLQRRGYVLIIFLFSFFLPCYSFLILLNFLSCIQCCKTRYFSCSTWSELQKQKNKVYQKYFTIFALFSFVLVTKLISCSWPQFVKFYPLISPFLAIAKTELPNSKKYVLFVVLFFSFFVALLFIILYIFYKL
jgi:hypothetical protein